MAADGDRASRRSRRATAAGSTAASSCCRRRCSTTSTGDATVWEREPLERLAREGSSWRSGITGFWQPMDTLRDKNQLEELWAVGQGAVEDVVT